MDERRALEAFAQGDDKTARRAFGVLCELTRGFVAGCVTGFLGHGDEVNDVVQQVFLRVWSSRPGFEVQGIGPWRQFLRTVARRCSMDFIARREKSVPLDEELNVPSGERPLVEALAEAMEIGDLFERADELWLGLDPSLLPETHTRQLLAAQLFYVDGVPWQSVIRILGSGPAAEEPLTRERLDAWLCHPGVIRSLAYHALYFSNDRLAATLLGLGPDGGPAELAEIARRAAEGQDAGAEGVGGWTWSEVMVILWRYRHAMLLSQILARTDCPLDRARIDGLLVKTACLMPFKDQMTSLLAPRGFQPGSENRKRLAQDGLWKRLVFEYAYVDDLAYRDILDRTAPAADKVDVRITETGALKSWIGMRRLLRELASSLQEPGGSPAHD